jgi:Sap, sulfolipid-1-addressing protein
MGKGISEVLTFAIGVAISPLPIIAVILMLFSRRARVNGPVFLLGWVLALVIVSGVAYLIAQSSNPSTSSSANDAISWGKLVLGVLFLLLAVRQWRGRPRPGTEPEMPKWMAGIDALTWQKALGFGLLLAGVNPKNLILDGSRSGWRARSRTTGPGSSSCARAPPPTSSTERSPTIAELPQTTGFRVFSGRCAFHVWRTAAWPWPW